MPYTGDRMPRGSSSTGVAGPRTISPGCFGIPPPGNSSSFLDPLPSGDHDSDEIAPTMATVKISPGQFEIDQLIRKENAPDSCWRWAEREQATDPPAHRISDERPDTYRKSRTGSRPSSQSRRRRRKSDRGSTASCSATASLAAAPLGLLPSAASMMTKTYVTRIAPA